MPPAKRAARNTRATPARARATSSHGQGGTPGRSNADVENPQLPEVQTQQSFAYGSTKTPLLPKALKAHSTMTTAQMAQTLDEEIDQAEANLRAHVAEAAAYGRDQAAERAERARRRSESRDSREDDFSSDGFSTYNPRARTAGRTPSRRTRRDDNPESEAGHPSQVHSPTPLEKIDEVSDETSNGNNPKATLPRTPTDRTPGSDEISTPNIPDWSYVREGRYHDTGIFAPRNESPVAGIRAQQELNRPLTRKQKIAEFFASVSAWFWYFLTLGFWRDLPAQGIDNQHNLSNIIRTLNQVALSGAVIFVAAFCFFLFSNTLLTSDEVNLVRNMTRGSYPEGHAVINLEHPDTQQIKQLLGEHSQRISEIEKSTKDTFHKAALLTEQLEKQYQSWQTVHKSNDAKVRQEVHEVLQHSTRINYFSPATGAVVDPFLTSPTKQKQFTLMQRLVLAPLGALRKYQSRPPVEALLSWQEQGDCWCAAPSSNSSEPSAQITVLLGHTIFPQELVVEHVYSTASTDPRTAPRHIELWAWDTLAVTHDDDPEGWVKIGDFEYKAPTSASYHLDAPGQSNVQVFEIPPVMRPTKRLAFQVVDNWGADVTCLYRVKLHGKPLHPHPVIGGIMQ